MAAEQETGGEKGFLFETREFLAVSGGDGDYTGVRLPNISEGSPATSSQVSVEPVTDGRQFPSKIDYYGD